MYQQILELYAEVCGEMPQGVLGQNGVTMIAFYSPAGGSCFKSISICIDGKTHIIISFQNIGKSVYVFIIRVSNCDSNKHFLSPYKKNPCIFLWISSRNILLRESNGKL